MSPPTISMNLRTGQRYDSPTVTKHFRRLVDSLLTGGQRGIHIVDIGALLVWMYLIFISLKSRATMTVQDDDAVDPLLFFQAFLSAIGIIIGHTNSLQIRDPGDFFKSVTVRGVGWSVAKLVADWARKLNGLKKARLILPSSTASFKLVREAIISLQNALSKHKYTRFTKFIQSTGNPLHVQAILNNYCTLGHELPDGDRDAACLLRAHPTTQNGVLGIKFTRTLRFELYQWMTEKITMFSTELNVPYGIAVFLACFSMFLIILYLAYGKKPRNVLTRIFGSGGKFVAAAFQKIDRSIRGGNPVTNNPRAGTNNARGFVRGNRRPNIIIENVTNNRPVPPTRNTGRVTTRSQTRSQTK